MEGVTEPGPAKETGQRSLEASLLSIVLVLEAFVVFFMTLTVFGLGLLNAAVAFGGGAALLVLLLVASRSIRRRWGVLIGWAMQGALLATGIIVPAMFIVAPIFIALWIFCFVQGRRIDRRKAQGASGDTSEKQGKEETA